MGLSRTLCRTQAAPLRSSEGYPSTNWTENAGQFSRGVKMQSVPHAKRVGICGNGVCERGERCDQFGQSQTSSGSCCMKDCPYVPTSCPAPADGPNANLPCSKNGLCLDSRGHCDCFQGTTRSTIENVLILLKLLFIDCNPSLVPHDIIT